MNNETLTFQNQEIKKDRHCNENYFQQQDHSLPLDPKKLNMHTNNTDKETMDLIKMLFLQLATHHAISCPICKINKQI